MKARRRLLLYYLPAGLAVAAVLWLLGRSHYLLFHSVVEIAGVVVAVAMFTVAWNTRQLSTNGYLTFLGIAYLFVAIIDLVHTLAYKGMGVFPGEGADLPTQLWIAGRGMEAVSLLLSPLFLTHRLRPWLTLGTYGAVTAALLVLIFPLDAFPVCYVESGPGAGLTPFKVGAEYVICGLLAAAFLAAWNARHRFSQDVVTLVMWAVATTIPSELAFTQYVSVYGDFNILGHILKAASFLLVFNATVVVSLRDPYNVLFRDLQQREQALRASEQRLAEANRMKDQFLATLSHELRTPLHAILGWSDILLKGSLRADKSQQALEAIARNAKAQSALINDVLDVSRIITGKLRLELQQVDAAQLVHDALEAARPAAVNKSVEVVTLASEPALLLGDADRLRQVVWNLLSNAVKFTPPGGRIEVTVRRREAEVEIVVRDTGAGLSADAIPHIFERFWQADASSTRQHRGLGLGLAIVRHLVELHGGRVQVESPGLGLGSTFTVAIPVHAVETPEPEAPVSVPEESENHGNGRPESLEGLKVLVVDDEADARELLRRVFIELGAEVVTAGTAREGLEAIIDSAPDVVVSDIGMPREDGYEFISRVRALPPERGGGVPAIAVTAYGRAEDRQRALNSGFDGHVTKPASPGELASAVAAVRPLASAAADAAGDGTSPN